MKILEICEFSEGICGVWQRVKQEASELVKRGHEVYVFSSNITKGTNEEAKSYDEIEGIKIYRFPIKFRVGENALFWNFEKKALALQPDIIIAHVYRHPHTNIALKIAKKLKKQGKKCKVFLVTHAPFVESKLRNFKLRIAVKLYDFFYSKNLNRFDKVIAITKWEIPFLLKLGCKKEKIVYIPNFIPEEFFKVKPKKFEGKKIIFLGRVSPIKNLETLLKALKIVSEKRKILLEIVGPVEGQYGAFLIKLIKQLDLNEGKKLVRFTPPIYDLKKKIEKLNEADIFVLPSKREAMPQSLIEAMSLEKIVISSRTLGSKEIIQDGKNGFLFEIENEKELAEKILFCLNKKNKEEIEKIRKKARKKAEEFSMSKIIKKLENLFLKN